MVQIIKEVARRPSMSERFGQAFSNVGRAAGEGIPAYMQAKENEASIKEQQQILGDLIGMDVSHINDPKILEQAFSKAVGFQQEQQNKRLIYENLIENGVSPEDAELYINLTTGGKTAFTKDVLEAKRRGEGVSSRKSRQAHDFIDASQEEELPYEDGMEEEVLDQRPSPKISVNQEIKEYLSKKDQGLTPAEKVARGKERYDTGLKQYTEAGSKLRGLSRDKQRIDILKDLASSKKLPQNLGRLNLDKEGNLRLPFMASNEAQRFIKTLNEFSENAKDTYGARVTNFDLQQMFRRYPGLWNSEEGIKQVLKQMDIVNDINSVYYKNLKSVYDEAGGVREIDADAAERFAEKRSEKRIEELSRKFKEIGEFEVKPSASEFKGKKIRDKKTGEVFISNGQEWVPENAL